jgi:hypothetical protein
MSVNLDENWVLFEYPSYWQRAGFSYIALAAKLRPDKSEPFYNCMLCPYPTVAALSIGSSPDNQPELSRLLTAG